MLATLLLITNLTTGAVDVMSFNDPVSCYNYAERMQNNRYSLECIPAGQTVVNVTTQNFYSVSRILNMIRNVTQ